jgi:hypothetical protein
MTKKKCRSLRETDDPALVQQLADLLAEILREHGQLTSQEIGAELAARASPEVKEWFARRSAQFNRV